MTAPRKGKPAETEAPAWSPRGLQAAALALVLPGLGHAFLRRLGRAGIFGASVVALTALGLAHASGLATPRPGEPLAYLATFANMGIGPAYFVLAWLGFQQMPDHATYEYGSTYMLTAGLLNLLVMLDAYDVGAGSKP